MSAHDVDVIRLGEFAGIAQVQELRDRALVAHRSGRPVVVECASTDHLDASALQLLLALTRAEAAHGRTCRLVGVRPPVQRFIELAGLSASLHLELAEQPAAWGETAS